MAGELYRPLIEDMTWSYSRVNGYSQCPYAWFMKYIRREPEPPNFYSSFGSLAHELFEEFYTGKLKKDEMLAEFLARYPVRVQGDRPQAKIVDSYIESGIKCFRDFEPLDLKPVAVEKHVKFDISGKKFVGFIDLVGEKDGKLILVDHKSRNLRVPKRKTANSQAQMEIDGVLKQLYLYAEAIRQETGRNPDELWINCYRTGTVIQNPYSEDKKLDAMEWARKEIDFIETGEDFSARLDWFYCANLCGYRRQCEYFELAFGRR